MTTQISEGWLKLIDYCEAKEPDATIAVKVVKGRPKSAKKVSESWMNVIGYCHDQLPFGELVIRIVDGCPAELVKRTSKMRFDKPSTIPYRDDFNFD